MTKTTTRSEALNKKSKSLLLLFLTLSTQILAGRSEENLFDIQQKLWNGEIVKLNTKLVGLTGFDLGRLDLNTNMVLQDSAEMGASADFYRYIHDPRINNHLLDIFEDTIIKKEVSTFFKKLLFVDDFDLGFSYTKYNESCYLETHSDYHVMINPNQKQYPKARLLSILYYTSNYIENCGGELIWNGEMPYKEIKPEKNTMYIFIPRMHSHHRIKDVKCGSRYAISGWLTSNRPSDTFLQMHHIMEYKLT